MSKPNTRENIEAVLKRKTIINGITKCWLFQGSLSDGYGMAAFEGKVYGVHRISAHIYLGLDLNDNTKQALHEIICPNRNCWNPDHLYIGTPKDNSEDMKITSTNTQTLRTHCPHGHPLDGIKSTGYRYCKTCNNIRNKSYGNRYQITYKEDK